MYHTVRKSINPIKAMITAMNNIPENSCLLIWKGGEPELLVQGRSTLQERQGNWQST